MRWICITAVLAILLAFWSSTTRAATWKAGDFIFSDELGGFRLLSVTGSGTVSDPIVIKEEITELRPVTLIIRNARGAENRITPQRSWVYLAMIKVVINSTKRVWTAFDLELQQQITKPSIYSDGLSFDQLGSFDENFQSDSYAISRQVHEPYDRIRFLEGSVDPGATARFWFFITDPTPVPEFYLLQEPALLTARRWPPFESLAESPSSR